jgi:PEGA domain
MYFVVAAVSRASGLRWSAFECQPPQPRIYVTESDSWQVVGGSGGNASGFGGGVAGGASPQTAEIIKTFGQRCPTVTVNNLPDASNYIVRLEHEGGKGLLRKKDKVVVFVKSTGDSIFSDSTLSIGGSVQSACAAIQDHWQKNAQTLLAASTPQPTSKAVASSAAQANVTIESSQSGADIEIDGSFVGNTPSTVSVAAGQHTIAVKKKGYADWSRTMTVSGGSVHLNADLEVAP